MYLVKSRKEYLPELIGYALGALFFFVARFIYYNFSHGLTSKVMELSFLPCLLSFIFFIVLLITKKKNGPLSNALLGLGVYSLSLYLFVYGVFDMASLTTGSLIIYMVLGIIFIAIGLGLFFIKDKKENPEAIKK